MHVARDMGVGIERETRIGVSENARQRFRVHSACQRVGGEGVPLRYNNDKREKASIQGVFCVCRCFSIPFPTVDYQRENCREKEAVKVKTKNLKRAFHFSE